MKPKTRNPGQKHSVWNIHTKNGIKQRLRTSGDGKIETERRRINPKAGVHLTHQIITGKSVEIHMGTLADRGKTAAKITRLSKPLATETAKDTEQLQRMQKKLGNAKGTKEKEKLNRAISALKTKLGLGKKGKYF